MSLRRIRPEFKRKSLGAVADISQAAKNKSALRAVFHAEDIQLYMARALQAEKSANPLRAVFQAEEAQLKYVILRVTLDD